MLAQGGKQTTCFKQVWRVASASFTIKNKNKKNEYDIDIRQKLGLNSAKLQESFCIQTEKENLYNKHRSNLFKNFRKGVKAHVQY